MKENNLFKSKKVTNKGITLIALVITIIVLLILAGVSIAMLTGENGILTQAQNAKTATEKAEAKERIELEVLGSYGRYGEIDVATLKANIAKNISGTLIGEETELPITVTVGDYTFKVKENGIVEEVTSGEVTPPEEPVNPDPPAGGDGVKVGKILTGTENKTYTKNGTAKIPVGFMIVPGCDDVSEGLVISDDPDDTEEDPDNIVAEGNQFVWIPVTDGNAYIRNTTYSDTNVSAKAYTDKDYLPDDIQTEIEEGKTDAEIGLINEKAERDAVVSARGFYIGRYEAGDSSATKERESETEGTLVSKKNVYVYSYISQEKAKAKAKTFKDNDYVKSSLISGIQWDATMATINGKKDGNGNIYDVTTAANDSTKSDRHTGRKVTTGQNIADKVYNIYDLEGNFYEYVAEKSTYTAYGPYVNRGGGCNDERYPASIRNYSVGSASSVVAFRLSLYVM